MVTELYELTNLICMLQMGEFYGIINYTIYIGEISKEVVLYASSLEGIFLK